MFLLGSLKCWIPIGSLNCCSFNLLFYRVLKLLVGTFRPALKSFAAASASLLSIGPGVETAGWHVSPSHERLPHASSFQELFTPACPRLKNHKRPTPLTGDRRHPGVSPFMCLSIENIGSPWNFHKASAPEPSQTAPSICTGTLQNLTQHLLRQNPPEPHHASSPIDPPEPHQVAAPETSGTSPGTCTKTL